MKVFLAGEGRHDLGSLANPPPYDAPAESGVLLAILQKCAGRPIQVMGALRWKDIRKFRAGGHASAEERALVGLALRAKETGCDLLAFVRDGDGDVERPAQIERGLERARAAYPSLKVVGSVAVQSLDGWVLALAGERRSEDLSPSKAKAALDKRGAGTTDARVATTRAADLNALPTDATSLKAFIERASACLNSPPP